VGPAYATCKCSSLTILSTLSIALGEKPLDIVEGLDGAELLCWRDVVDGNRLVGTRVTAPAFNYLRTIESENEGLVDQTGIEPVTS